MILSHVLYGVEYQADEIPSAPILLALSATRKGHDLIFSSLQKSVTIPMDYWSSELRQFWEE